MAFSLKDVSQLLSTGHTKATSAKSAATLKQGAAGESVTQLQQAGLYKGDLDGLYGAKTAKAVRAFQKASGLPQTGEADAQTAAAVSQAITAEDPGVILE
jgi:peptidoglycan hydrolase-like protein with peptidoglycan-binding domain